MFNSSVVSYPERGHFGNSQYRGNTTGKIIIDLIDNFLPCDGFFVDPAVGGGTTIDVVNHLCIANRFAGFDLHSGFNLIRDDLTSAVGQQADLIFFHPPYGGMIHYSGNMWGEPHKDDLSRMSDYDFEQALKLALVNISDATKAGGHYAVLIGNQRKKGRYLNWSSMTEQLAPDPLVEEIIKCQHNCVSDNRQYAKPLIRINHEKLLIFKKGQNTNAITDLEGILNGMSETFMANILVMLKRLFQCRDWTQKELFDTLAHLAKNSPYELFPAIDYLLKTEHFKMIDGRYTLA